ncbi:MAG: AAA family ATPase [Deltaproteobacteria bacterium]|nr:AAA family ATPase [Deltaproteobacteria bacterium]
MASAEQIKALIESHVHQDDDRFVAVALQVAARAARQGHGRLAEEIKALIDDAKARGAQGSKRPIPIAAPRGDLIGLLSVCYPQLRLTDMVLAGPIHARLSRILQEHRAQSKLRSHGLRPRRKLLLVGPPGSGKTMTAGALAGELHLALYVILLDGLITKFMGETAAKLRLVFEAIAEQRGVYLFDEFDAIGSERARGNDVGEIRRVLNSFLQFLEQDDSPSLLVAATNHQQALDAALFRRFDDVIEYGIPDAVLAEVVLRNKLAAFDVTDLNFAEAARCADGLSYGEITQACEAAAKDAVLADSTTVATAALVAALDERRSVRRPDQGDARTDV